MIAPESLAAGERLPSRRIGGSERLGWSSVLVRAFDDPPSADTFTTAATPDLLVVCNVAGELTMESRSLRGVRRARYAPGVAGTTAPLATSTLAWRSPAGTRARSVHVHLAATTLDEAATVLAPRTRSAPDTLAFADARVNAIVGALWGATQRAAPALEAEALALALAWRVLHPAPATADAVADARGLAPATLRRVLDHMEAHLAAPVGLDELAAVAALSKFHFLREFSAATGATPQRYLTRLRMERAARALRRTNDPIHAVAREHGYATSGQFAKAFRRAFATTPSEYRRRFGA